MLGKMSKKRFSMFKNLTTVNIRDQLISLDIMQCRQIICLTFGISYSVLTPQPQVLVLNSLNNKIQTQKITKPIVAKSS